MKPYRERVEVFALDPQGKVFGAHFPEGPFGAYGGGVDPGETAEAAAAREFEEETGHRVDDVWLLPIPPHVVDWDPADTTGSPEQRQRRKDFRGTRTVYAGGTFVPGTGKPADPQKGRPVGSFHTLADAIATAAPGGVPAGLAAANAARWRALIYLRDGGLSRLLTAQPDE